MQQTLDEIVKIQPKGLVTIPKKFREKYGINDNTLLIFKAEEDGIYIKPVQALNYPVRSYTDAELTDFFKLDQKEGKELKKKGLI